MRFASTFVLVLATAAPTIAAQEKPQPKPQPKGGASSADAELRKKYEEKLKEPFLTKAPWITDYDKALAASKQSGKLIFGFFTRSYAFCPPCHDLETHALSEDRMPEWGANYVLFCHVTTQIPGQKNDDLLTKVGGQGFPHLVFLDSDGEVLATHEDERTLDAFTKTGETALEARELKRKAASGDSEAKVEWFLRQLDAGSIDSAKARARVKELGALTPERSKAIESKIFDLEVLEIPRSIKKQEDVAAAAKKVYDLVKANRVPKGDSAFEFCWQILLGYGSESKNVAYFEAGKNLVFERYEGNPKYKGLLDKVEADLAELKKGAASGKSGG